MALILLINTLKFIRKGEINMVDQDLTALKAAAVVDCRGSACPGPLMEAKKAIGKVKVGEVLESAQQRPRHQGRHPRCGPGRWATSAWAFVPGDGYDRIFITRKKYREALWGPRSTPGRY